MQQTEVFSHFLAGTKAHNAKKGGRRSKQAEDAEDHELVEAAEEYHAVRLTVQPECIKFGKMREYQLAGLNWMIRLFDHGINGILADEMVCSRRPFRLAPVAATACWWRLLRLHAIDPPRRRRDAFPRRASARRSNRSLC